MSSSNWTVAVNSLSGSDVLRGVSAGSSKPNGGGSFAYGFHSQVATDGAVGLYTNLANFSPTAANKGGSIRGALMRAGGGGSQGYANFLFIGLQGTDLTTNKAYILGIGDAEPGHIVLKKARLDQGLDDVAAAPATNNVLLRSTSTYAANTWVHLRLDMIVQGTGDVLLQVYVNDLDSNTVSSPVWTTPPGMEGDQYPTLTGFVDDALQVNTGSAPLTNGRMGFGFYSEESNRRAYVDHLIAARQL